MRVKKLLVMALIALPTMVMAQSTYEPVGSSDNKTPLENKTVNPVYQQWLSQYVEVGRKINDISAQYQREIDKRGYPRIKTLMFRRSTIR